jgi:hypothetical protein
MIRRLVAFFILMLLTAPALPAFAQDGKQAQQNPADAAVSNVVVLEFVTYDAPAEVMDYFYRTLNAAIDAHPEMQVKSGNDVSVNEMVLVLGCEAASPECLARLSDFVQGDRIAFGTVRHSEGVYLISLKLFDFSSGDFVSQVNDATVQGTPEQIKTGLSAVVEGFLYGDVGQLQVAVSGAADAQVYFDGQKMGPAPLSLDGLPLGEHAVTVETADGRRQTEKVTLNRGEVAKVQLDFAAAEAIADSGDSSGYIVPGWAATGIGAAGLVAGIIASVQLSSYSSEADTMVCGDALCAQSSASAANRLQANMDSAYTMSVIGYSVAAVGLAVGGYFLYEGYAGSGSETAPAAGPKDDDADVRFGFAPRADGASVGLSFGF